MSHDDEEAEDAYLDAELLEHEIAAYRARHLAEHLAGGRPEEIFALIEEEGFLVDQVTELGTYAAASRTLLQLALPHAREERFLLYGATVLALQQLATRLDDQPTARAILRVGGSDLVAGLTEQLARPLDRARIWALLAAADPHGPASGEFRRQAVETVDSFLESPASVLSPEDEDCLDLVLYELAPHLAAAWSRWQASPRLGEGLRERLRLDFLEGLWREGAWGDPFGWDEAKRCPRLDGLAVRIAHLLVQLGEKGIAGAAELVAGRRREDPAAGWRLTFFVGARFRQREAALARAWWRAAIREGPPPENLLDAAALGFFWKLAESDLAPLLAQVATPPARAVVTLAILRAAQTRARLEEARAAVECLEDPLLRFQAALAFAGAAAAIDSRLARRWLRALGDSLEAAAYRAPLHLLVIYLETLGDLEPAAARRELHEVAFSPGFTADQLVQMADSISNPALWRTFLEAVEPFALAVAENELAAFELRSRILERLGLALVDRDDGMGLLDVLTERQLLEEEEKLRLELGARLVRGGRDEEARRVIAKLPEGAARRLGEIRLLAGGPDQQLDAAALYSTLCDPTPIEDELWGLRALLEAPLEMEDLFERVLARIVHPDTRTLFVLELVRHRAAFEHEHFGRLRDPRSLLEMARPLLVVEEERYLADLVPELVATGLLAGRKFALAELLESAEGLVRLPRLAPQDLLEAFSLLALTAARAGDAALTAQLFEALTRLPALFGPAEQERARGLRPLVPRLVGLLEQGAAVGAAGRWLARLGPGWLLAEDPWPAIVGFCRADAAKRKDLAAGWPADVSPELLEAAAILFAATEPATTLALLARLPAGTPRQSLAARLIRLRWIAPLHVAGILRLVDDEALQRNTLVHAHLEADDPSFLENLADAIAHGHVDSHHPADLPIVRRLWRCRAGLREEALHRAARRAFQRGPEAGERALRIWLHALLAPQPGREQREKLDLWQRLSTALGRARRLDPSGEIP